MKNTKLTFIGCGNMGCSLIGGLISNGHNPDSINGAEPDQTKSESISKQYGIRVLNENIEAVHDTDIVILAIKPQNLLDVVRQISQELIRSKPLLISIAAGIQISSIQKHLGDNYPVVRVMPNTPALIQTGASALYASPAVENDQKILAEEIMRSVGLAIWLDKEELMDAVTALSGSGPAYFFLVMECMEKAATKLGLSREQARILTIETAFGAAKMALESKSDVGLLRQQVTSPGGTTEAALNVLIDKGEIEEVFFKALQAAKKRSEEIALEFGNT